MVDVNFYSIIALIVFMYMCGWFGVAVARKRNDVADIAWGGGFVLIAWSAYLVSTHTLIAFLINVLVTVWGVRLVRHIAVRHRRGTEDARYAQWRKTWTFFYTRSFFQVFMLQGTLLYLVALPVIAVNTMHDGDGQVGLWTFVGLVLWVCGFLCEVVADQQLRIFLSDVHNRGTIMDRGLWRYSRHPNYFGEVMLWWGIGLTAFSVTGQFIVFIGPLVITILILFVSGIPMLERRYAHDRAYQAYKKRTSIFIPFFPKK